MNLQPVTSRSNDLLGRYTPEQICHLVNLNLIWFCNGCDEYHPAPGVELINIELALKGFGG